MEQTGEKRKLNDRDLGDLYTEMHSNMAHMENRINANMQGMYETMNERMTQLLTNMQQRMMEQLSGDQQNPVNLRSNERTPKEKLLKAFSAHPFNSDRTWGNKLWLNGNNKAQFKPWFKKTSDHIQMYWNVDVQNMEPEIEKLIMAKIADNMSNAPKRWYESWYNTSVEDEVSWGTFKTAAIKRWDDPIFELSNMVDLMALPKCSGDISRFNETFKAQLDLITDIDQHMSEKLQKALYYSKLPDEQRNIVGLTPKETLANWMNKVEMQVKSVAEPTKSKHCYKCGGSHLANECKSNDERIQKHTDTCKRCKQRRAQLAKNQRDKDN